MLKSLQIDNIAVIEHSSIDFAAGLNILTGETGAGKSIIIDSIHAVTGEKTSRELIRTGADNAAVSALFSDVSDSVKEKISALGLDNETDGTLLLQRKLGKDGKNACRINGVNVTLSMLKTVGADLINIHGQRDSQALLDSDKHIFFLDEYAVNDTLLADYQNIFRRYVSVQKQIHALSTDEATKLRQTQMLEYQINELRQADIKPGEIKDLRHRKGVIENSVRLKRALSDALNALMGGGDNPGAVSLLNGASSDVSSVLSVTKDLSPVVSSLNEAAETAGDAASVLDDVIRQLDSLEEDMDAIGDRLDLLYRLSRKYGETEEAMLSFLQNAENELNEIVFSDEKLRTLNEEAEQLAQILTQKAEILSGARNTAADKLNKAIENELHYLDMPHAVFITAVRPDTLSENGADTVEFLISANPGETPKPLGKVASGGELSRIMLAMKNVLLTKNGAQTLIFDEIDTGVSGSAAGKIAVKLAELSRTVQVLCITHSPQIAAFADEQKFLSKHVENNKTYTDVTTLSHAERTRVIANMTFGDSYSEEQRFSAEQLIQNAEQKKHHLP